MAIKLIMYAVVLMYSFLLINAGITGMVVSESCCFGDECPADYKCEAGDGIQQNNRFVELGLGVFLMMGSLFMIHSRLKHHF